MCQVSVVIPAFNRRAVVGEAIASALSQTLAPLEVVVVDDGSDDGTHKVALAYGEPVRCLRRDNGGPAAARNTGVIAARGDLVAFLDSDDAWHPHCLERLVANQRRYDLDMVFADVEVHQDGKLVARSFLAQKRVGPILTAHPGVVPDIFAMLLVENPVATSAVLARRSVLLSVGLFDEQLRSVEDRDLWLRVAKVGRVGVVPESLAVVRRRGASLSGNARLADAYRAVVIRRYVHDPLLTPEQRAAAMTELARIHFDLAYHSARRANLPAAAAHLLRSYLIDRNPQVLTRGVTWAAQAPGRILAGIAGAAVRRWTARGLAASTERSSFPGRM